MFDSLSQWLSPARARAAAPVRPAPPFPRRRGDDDERGRGGWHQSSHDLLSGVVVIECDWSDLASALDAAPGVR